MQMLTNPGHHLQSLVPKTLYSGGFISCDFERTASKQHAAAATDGALHARQTT